MTVTVNISLPEKLHKEAKKLVEEGKYSSISEVVRAGLRRVIENADRITENDFPGWFEDQVLEAAAEPVKIKKRRGKDDKNRAYRQVRPTSG